MKKLFAAAILAATTLANFQPAYAKAWPTNKPAITAAKSATANDLTTVLPQTNIVAVMDWTKVNTFIRGLISDQKALAEFDKFQNEIAEYGFNLRDLRQIALGGSYGKDLKLSDFYLMLDGNFDREKILSTLAEKAKEPLISRTEEYQNRTLYFLKRLPETAQHNLPAGEFAMAFLSQQLVVVGTSAHVKQVVDVQSGRRANILANPEMASYLSRINSQAALRFAVNLDTTTPLAKPAEATPGAGKSRALTNDDLDTPSRKTAPKNQSGPGAGPLGALSQITDTVQAFYGTLDLDLKLTTLDMSLIAKNEAAAKELSDSLKGLVALGKVFLGPQAAKDPQTAKLLEVINLFKVNEVGKEVKVNFALNETLINELRNIINKATNKNKK